MKTQSKKYYYNMQLETAEKIKDLPVKPSLLMHTCCAVMCLLPDRLADAVL